MATQILRTVDRWRFETPLALVLAAAAGFAVLAMPHETFGRLPIAGHLGMAGHIGLALVLAIICGIAGYTAMRRPAKIVPIDEDIDGIDELDAPSGMAEDRLLRLRRADRHPDAPPRAPIRASRDLGEPFMDVGVFGPSPLQPEPEEPVIDETAAAYPVIAPTIADADFVEIDHAAEPVELPSDANFVEAAAGEEPGIWTALKAMPTETHGLGEPFFAVPAPEAPAASIVETPVAAAPVAVPPAATPIVAPSASAPAAQDGSIAAMMERLSAGMARRSGRPAAAARDMRPALRDALDELNRLAAQRG